MTYFLAGLNPTAFSAADGKPNSDGFYKLEFGELTTKSTRTGSTSGRLPTDSEALVWVDRNSMFGKGKNWYGKQTLQTKEKVYLLLSTLDIKRDVIVSRQCCQSSFMFLAVYFAPALVHLVNSIEISGNGNKKQLFMEACLKTDGLQDAAATATGRRMFACLGDGLGCVPELLTAFIEA